MRVNRGQSRTVTDPTVKAPRIATNSGQLPTKSDWVVPVTTSTFKLGQLAIVNPSQVVEKRRSAARRRRSVSLMVRDNASTPGQSTNS